MRLIAKTMEKVMVTSKEKRHGLRLSGIKFTDEKVESIGASPESINNRTFFKFFRL